jgi:hypothetical protein
MKSLAYKSWYEKNRDAVRAKQRERDATRLAERRQQLAEHPELVEEERMKYRQKYHRVRQNKMKRELEKLEASLTDEEAKQLVKNIIDNEAYRSFTPSMMKRLAQSISASDDEENESGAEGDGGEEGSQEGSQEGRGEEGGQTSG